MLSAQPLPPPLKPDPSLKPTLLVLPGGLLLLVTNGQAVVFNTSTPAAPALLKRALPSSKPTLVMVTDGGLDLYDQAPAVCGADMGHGSSMGCTWVNVDAHRFICCLMHTVFFVS